jgi:hypothetical protein
VRTSSIVRLAGGDEPPVGLGVVRDDHRRLVERDAAGPFPGATVDAQGGAEGLSPGRAEHAPGGDHVGRGIANADSAEVDHRAEPAAAHEQVGPEQVGVDPHRRPVPHRRLERAFPGGDGRVVVDDARR